MQVAERVLEVKDEEVTVERVLTAEERAELEEEEKRKAAAAALVRVVARSFPGPRGEFRSFAGGFASRARRSRRG